jgi:hypothetical protein
MAIVKNIVATVGEYENKQWEKKKQYLTIGKLIEKDDKLSIKIDCIPVWRNGRAWVYEQKEKWETKASTNIDDDLPF